VGSEVLETVCAVGFEHSQEEELERFGGVASAEGAVGPVEVETVGPDFVAEALLVPLRAHQ